MTKIFTTIVLIVALAACGGNGTPEEAADLVDTTAANDITLHPDYDPGLALVVDNDCYDCHKVEEEMVGPSYQKIAQKYAGQEDAIDILANRIMTGGSGVWGDTAMTPHPTVTKEDAVRIVKYIMLLKE